MKQAPDFTLPDQHDKQHTLSEYRGKWIVLYFYPMDETPGCTTEACNFRDARDAIAEFGKAVVMGVSKDSVKSHHKFATNHDLNFTLLSDPEHKVIKAYDSWDTSSLLGKLIGTKRNTFIIDPEGNIVKEYRNVNPETHAAEIIDDLKLLQNPK